MLKELEKISHQKDYTETFKCNHFKILGKDLAPHNIIKTVIVHFEAQKHLYTVVTRHSKDQRFKGTDQIAGTVLKGNPYKNQVQNLHIVTAQNVGQVQEVFKMFPLFQKLNIGFLEKVKCEGSFKIPKFQYLTIHSKIPELLAKEIKGLKQLRCLGCVDVNLIQGNGNTLKDLSIHQPNENIVKLDFQIKSQLNIFKVFDGNELECSKFLENQQKLVNLFVSSCTLDLTKEKRLEIEKRNCDLKSCSFKIKFNLF